MELDIQCYKNGKLRNPKKLLEHFLKRYIALHKKTRRIKEKAAFKIRSLKVGKVPWSPKYQIIVDFINFWRHVRKWKKNCNTSRQIMQRLAKDIGIKWRQVKTFLLKSAEKKWFKAHKKYYSQKKTFYKLQKEFQQSYIDALAKEAHVPKATMEKRMKQEAKQRYIGEKKSTKNKRKRN